MNEIQKQFEKRTGLSYKSPECKYELTIFRKGFEAGRIFQKEIPPQTKTKTRNS